MPAAHEIEELHIVHLARGRAVGALDVVGLNLQARQGDRHRIVGTEDEVPVGLVGVRLLRARLDPDEPAEYRERLVAQGSLVQQVGVRVRGEMVLQRVMVEDLVGVSEVQAEHLRVAARGREPGLDVGAARARSPRRRRGCLWWRPCSASQRMVLKWSTLRPQFCKRDVAQIRALADVELDRPVAQGGFVLLGPRQAYSSM